MLYNNSDANASMLPMIEMSEQAPVHKATIVVVPGWHQPIQSIFHWNVEK